MSGNSKGTKTFFDGHPIGSAHKRFLIIASLAYVFDQMNVINFGFIGPILMKNYGWTMQQFANVNSFNMLGMFIGALFGGWLADKIGRKKGLLTCILIFSLSSLANAAFTNYNIFLIMRTITGFGTIGMVTIAMAYISEMMPSESRGKYQALSIAVGVCGMPISAILAKVVIPLSYNSWRSVFVLGGLGLVITVVGSFWLKESPRWLVAKGRLDEAAKVLNEIVPDAQLPLNAVELAKSNNSGYIETFRVMFSSAYGKRTATLFIVVFGATLGSFYLSNFYPSIHAQMGFSQAVVLNLAIYQLFLNPVGDYLVSFISDNGGRKTPITVIFSIFGCLFIIQGLCSTVLSISIMLLLKGLFVSAAMTITWTYLAESYPTHIRTTASGILFGSGRLAASFLLFTVPVVYESYGYFGVNLVNGLIYIIPGIVVLFIGDSTAKVSLEELSPSISMKETSI
ncbi:arabinose efflux permease family protein [Desulfosporosinus orientis DSM 765]|uniref:Arabinose efflux permease family protein n=1 Tax=Desulfosporosinus orientis (strain ATCC 19365 / DSM 765 / NCIMB 8382 / VKM B-1628 / Singapore I) TaxID=768706 RepID=G7WEL3_DESOD|nr:MFS transporter [Desulfosporosinus orientis]AET66904.1 arabinose efflux permease family protein [Desulfosporosinus orientis DSM 765]